MPSHPGGIRTSTNAIANGSPLAMAASTFSSASWPWNADSIVNFAAWCFGRGASSKSIASASSSTWFFTCESSRTFLKSVWMDGLSSTSRIRRSAPRITPQPPSCLDSGKAIGSHGCWSASGIGRGSRAWLVFGECGSDSSNSNSNSAPKFPRSGRGAWLSGVLHTKSDAPANRLSHREYARSETAC